MSFEEYITYRCMDYAAETKKNTEKDTRIQSILELLEDYGDIPDQLKNKLEEVNDMELLKKYHKLAAKADSIEAFLREIDAL